MPRLYVFSGSPGVGKTTIARLLATELSAVYLRVDTVETSLMAEGISEQEMHGKGYSVCYEIARDNLKIGNDVVADMVNPIALTREVWRDVAEHTAAELMNIGVVCSDPIEHRRRVEQRVADIEGHRMPTWAEFQAREYEPWSTPVLTIDTARLTPTDAVALTLASEKS